MVLFIAASIASVYVAISKTYVEQTMPPTSQLDAWTENSTLWASNDPDITESTDCITGICYGNKSIQFSITNGTQIWMQLTTPDPVNCSSLQGYKNMSFRIKLNYSTTDPKNVTLFLYSSPSDYFYYNLTEHLLPVNTTIWNNLTIPLGPGTQRWSTSTNQSDWSNIIKVRFEFDWPKNTEATVLLDGLFFRGIFNSELKNASSHILSSSLSAFMQFTVQWFIFSGMLYILGKALGSETVWRILLIVVGFTLIPLVIQSVVNTAMYATLPKLYYPLEYFSGVNAEFEVAHTVIMEQTSVVFQISNYIQIAVSIWIIALCAIVLRLLDQYSWTKGIVVSTSAYFVSLLAQGFLLAY